MLKSTLKNFVGKKHLEIKDPEDDINILEKKVQEKILYEESKKKENKQKKVAELFEYKKFLNTYILKKVADIDSAHKKCTVYYKKIGFDTIYNKLSKTDDDKFDDVAIEVMTDLCNKKLIDNFMFHRRHCKMYKQCFNNYCKNRLSGSCTDKDHYTTCNTCKNKNKNNMVVIYFKW